MHEGLSIEVIRSRFKDYFENISKTELEQLKTQLFDEDISQTDIENLFKLRMNTTNEPQAESSDSTIEPGHPVQVLRTENMAIKSLINQIEPLIEELGNTSTSKVLLLELRSKLNLLNDIEKHYIRKEELIFPTLAKFGYDYEIKDWKKSQDEICTEMKALNKKLSRTFPDKSDIKLSFSNLFEKILRVIHQEETYFIPITLEKLSNDDWKKIGSESDSLGYCIVAPEKKWKSKVQDMDFKKIRLPTGYLNLTQLAGLFSNLPFQITYVDENDRVIYFSHGTEPIFNRNLVVLGRHVQNCHPPRSVDVVNRILQDFKSNKRDSAEFWINLNDKFVLIRYIAIRSPEDKKYLGCIEITQNITDIKKLEGEKRLLDMV